MQNKNKIKTIIIDSIKTIIIDSRYNIIYYITQQLANPSCQTKSWKLLKLDDNFVVKHLYSLFKCAKS